MAELPPGVLYSTTIPGSGMPLTTGISIYPNYPDPNVTLVVTDASGNSYIAGAVAWSGLPTTPGVVQPHYAGGTCNFGAGFSGPCPSTFIAKFDSNGVLLFLTYLGGAGSTLPSGLAVDGSGDIYLGGQTNSADGDAFNAETFVTKLSGDGKTLLWSKPGSGVSVQVATAPDGSVFCLATTTGGTATLTKLSQTGQSLATVNLPSGTQPLAVGADGSVYIGGASSGVTATPGVWQTTSSQGFVAKMKPSLSGFAWLTSVPGTVGLLQPAPDGSLWASGTTTESNFPVLPGALQPQLSPGGNPSGYLIRLSADGSKALAATYLAAPVTALASDASGNAIFSAGPGPSGFRATPGAEWPCPQQIPGDPPAVDASDRGFFGKIDSAGQHLLWGTWTGPSIPIGPVAADTNGNAVAAGDLPGQEGITLTAMTSVPGSLRLVETCIAQSGSPNVAAGPLAPGELFSIYGAGFGPEQGVVAQPSGNKFGTELAGVQVLIENVPVALLYVSSEQIDLVAPYLLTGRIAAHIRIVTASATSNEVILGVRPSVPEIFADLSGTAVILNQNGILNSQNNPAHIGDTVAMFVSGVGQTKPPGVDGEIPQAAGGTPVLPIRVQLNASFASVTYAGNAPGLVSGTTQVNFQIPQMPAFGAGPPYQALIELYAGAASNGAIVLFEGNITAVNVPYLWYE